MFHVRHSSLLRLPFAAHVYLDGFAVFAQPRVVLVPLCPVPFYHFSQRQSLFLMCNVYYGPRVQDQRQAVCCLNSFERSKRLSRTAFIGNETMSHLSSTSSRNYYILLEKYIYLYYVAVGWLGDSRPCWIYTPTLVAV